MTGWELGRGGGLCALWVTPEDDNVDISTVDMQQPGVRWHWGLRVQYVLCRWASLWVSLGMWRNAKDHLMSYVWMLSHCVVSRLKFLFRK